MSDTVMTLQDAKAAGREAFEAGRTCTPALDPGFIQRACAGRSGEPGEVAEVLRFWHRGWTEANLTVK